MTGSAFPAWVWINVGTGKFRFSLPLDWQFGSSSPSGQIVHERRVSRTRWPHPVILVGRSIVKRDGLAPSSRSDIPPPDL